MDLSSLDIHAPNLYKDYTEHVVFSQLDDLINFYDMLSFSTMGFLTSGLIGVVNLNTHVFTSIKGTIDSIKLVLSIGRINDAYALLRKYYDSTIINVYINLLIEDNSHDHMHYNYYHNLIYNDNQVHLKNRVKYLDVFSNDLKSLFIQHFAYFYYLIDHYMTSSDYVDHLDVGMTPPEDSQYWVASFIQDTFDNWVKPNRPDIAEAILANTIMRLN